MDWITEEMIHKKSPQEITSLLYEACERNVEEAIEATTAKDFVLANQKLQKANDILHRLGVGLNYEAGIIADQLDALYNYMAEQLITANLKKDVQKMQEVLAILQELSSAWRQALKTKSDKQPAKKKQQAQAYEKLALFEN